MIFSAPLTLTRSTVWKLPTILLSYLFVIGTALCLRLIDLGQFVTVDEVQFWIGRSERWAAAINSGRWADTAITSHPGITTMWLGAAGINLTRWLHSIGALSDLSFATRIGMMQLPIAVAHTVGVAVGYALLRRLLSPGTALLAAWLWATDPFTIAFDRVLHVDGLTGTGLVISLLAACVYWFSARKPGWLVLSAAAATFGALSKWPGLIAAPWVAGIALSTLWGAPGGLRRNWRALIWPLLVWGAVALVTALLLWPALWAAPARVLDLFQNSVEREGMQPHPRGNFYLGREELSPGWTFYATALAFRTTPWALLGIFALPLALKTQPAAQRRILAICAACIISFVICLSPFPKKFNRYIVPIFPLVNIVAAAGLAGLATSAQRRVQRVAPKLAEHNLLPLAGGALVGLLAVGTAQALHPYAITYFNPLLGGDPLGARTFQAGWGEGLEEAAAWLNQQPDITGVITASTRRGPLQPYMRSGIQVVEPPVESTFPSGTGYAVVYLRDAQTVPLAPFDTLIHSATPIHTIKIHGIEYVWIYAIPPAISHPLTARFGEGLGLRGFDLVKASSPNPAELRLHLSWQVNTPPGKNLALFVHVFGADGQRIAQIDPQLPSAAWQAGRFTTTEIAVPLPPARRAAPLRVVLGVYDPASGARLPLSETAPAAVELAGPAALCLLSRAADGTVAACPASPAPHTP